MWKKRFDKEFMGKKAPHPQKVVDFISTEVVNNLINQVCKELDATPEYKDQLIKQWT